MGKFVVRPYDIYETGSIELLCQKLKEQVKIYCLTGAERIGKSAFCVKVQRHLFSLGDASASPLFISFDQNARYWETKLLRDYFMVKEDTSVYPGWNFFFFGKSKNITEVLSKIERKIAQHSCSIIVLDGMEHCLPILKDRDLWKIEKLLIKIQRQLKISFLIATNRKDLFSGEKMITTKKMPDTEHWYLENPMYLGGDIKRQGDVWLKIGLNQLAKKY